MNRYLDRAAGALAVSALFLSGCNSGKREGKAHFGPGSTGSGQTSTSASGTGVGAFAPGPDLNAPRGQHAATLLNDGRLLVTGGFDGQSILGSTEVFDPKANTWTDVSTLAPNPDDGLMITQGGQLTARRHHSAVTLMDDRVLVAGGHGVERLDAQGNPVVEAMKTTFAFDPQTHTYQQVGDLHDNRFLHQAARLTNGEAIVTGGVALPNGAVLALTSAEVFDPVTDQWRSLQTTQVGGRSSGLMVPLGNNNALLYGGADVIDYVGQNLRALVVMNFTSQEPEVYESTNGVFRRGPTGAYPKPRMDAGGSVVSTGDAFFAGGRTEDPATAPPLILDDRMIYDLTPGTPSLEVVDTTERYDHLTDTIVPGPALQIPRWGCEVAELGTTADMLIVGGLDEDDDLLTTCEIYSAFWDRMIGTVDMSTARMQFTAHALRDGRVLVVGGLDANRQGLASVEVHTR